MIAHRLCCFILVVAAGNAAFVGGASAVDCNSNGTDDAAEVGEIELPSSAPRTVATGGLIHDHAQTIVLVDIDGNALPDLITGYDDQKEVTIRRNLGGSFGPVLTVDSGSSSNEFAVGDINMDGLGDIVTTSAFLDQVRLHAQSSPGTFQSPVILTRPGAHKVTLGDVDGDGRSDLIVSEVGDSNQIAISRSSIDPQFRDITRHPVPDVVNRMEVRDLDGDGDGDLVIATDRLMLMLNQSGAEFSPPIDLRVGGTPFAIADVNGDGRNDIITVTGQRELLTLVNLGDGRRFARYSVASSDFLVAITAVDYDNDTDLDLVTVGDDLQFFANAGHGQFFPSATLVFPDDFFSQVQVPDLDADGEPEVVALDPVDDRIFVVPFAFIPGAEPDCNVNHVPDECDAPISGCEPDGVPEECEADSDGDRVADACDQCATADDRLDSDDDGIADCQEQCPYDSLKTVAGACGCGVAEVDEDHDAIADCIDTCPGKRASAADRDGDGVGDACDACRDNPLRFDDTICNCDSTLRDTDLDGIPDCADECPSDPAKQAAGICGCFLPEIDLGDVDRDDVPNCTDNCMLAANKNQADGDSDGLGDVCDNLVGENCTADCDGNFAVRQNDLRTVISAIFDSADLALCDTADADRDGAVRAAEITLGILQADSCLPSQFVPNPRAATEFVLASTATLTRPSLCRHDNGHLLVWHSDERTLMAQRLDLSGSAIGRGVQLDDSSSTINQLDLSCADDGSGFAVWTEGLRVMARFIRGSGTANGSPLEIANPRPIGNRLDLVASGNGAGLYVVAWSDAVRRNGTLSNHAHGQLFGSDGRALTQPMDMGESGFYENSFDVAMAPNGFFWLLRLTDNSISKYATDGVETGDIAQLSSNPSVFVERVGAELAVADGAMMAAWIEPHFNEALSISARVFTDAGDPIGPDIHVASPLALLSSDVTVDALGGDQFVFVWVTTEPAIAIKARVYSISRGFLAEPFQVNEIVGASTPAVSAVPQGFLAAWYGGDGFGQSGVFGRRLSAEGRPLSLP